MYGDFGHICTNMEKYLVREISYLPITPSSNPANSAVNAQNLSYFAYVPVICDPVGISNDDQKTRMFAQSGGEKIQTIRFKTVLIQYRIVTDILRQQITSA